jgi:hypothetical protein
VALGRLALGVAAGRPIAQHSTPAALDPCPARCAPASQGSCSGLSVDRYFGLVAKASSRYLPLASAALAKTGITPRSEPYNLGQVCA